MFTFGLDTDWGSVGQESRIGGRKKKLDESLDALKRASKDYADFSDPNSEAGAELKEIIDPKVSPARKIFAAIGAGAGGMVDPRFYNPQAIGEQIGAAIRTPGIRRKKEAWEEKRKAKKESLDNQTRIANIERQGLDDEMRSADRSDLIKFRNLESKMRQAEHEALQDSREWKTLGDGTLYNIRTGKTFTAPKRDEVQGTHFEKVVGKDGKPVFKRITTYKSGKTEESLGTDEAYVDPKNSPADYVTAQEAVAGRNRERESKINATKMNAIHEAGGDLKKAQEILMSRGETDAATSLHKDRLSKDGTYPYTRSDKPEEKKEEPGLWDRITSGFTSRGQSKPKSEPPAQKPKPAAPAAAPAPSKALSATDLAAMVRVEVAKGRKQQDVLDEFKKKGLVD